MPRVILLYVSVLALACAAANDGHGAESIFVEDDSFEAVVVDASPEVIDGPGNWARAWGGGFAGFYNPSEPLYPNQEGDYLGNIFVNDDGNFAAFFQDVVQIEEGTYTLTVGVGHEPGAEPTVAPFHINFEAVGYGSGKILVEENTFPVGTVDSSGLTDITVDVTFPPGHPEIGRTLRPVLLTTGSDPGTNPEDPRGSYMMDNVRLDFTPTAGPDRTIQVGQPSFDPALWNTPFGSGANATHFRPEEPLFSNQEGEQLGALTVRPDSGWGAAFWQDTTPIEEGTYSLTVGVAHHPDFEPTTAPFRINFESVSETGAVTLIGENEFPVGSANSDELTDLTATLEIPAGMPNIGETLRLVLLTTGTDVGSNPGADDPRAIYLLDDVRLEFESAAGPEMDGDFNGDGFVDIADYNLWRDNLGAADEVAINNAGDGAGGVDAADYAVWKTNFGSTEAASIASHRVPEPGALALAIFAGLSAVVHLRRP